MEDGLFRTRRKQERTLRQGRKQRGTDEKAEKGFFRENFISVPGREKVLLRKHLNPHLEV